ncbi:hypothetical protein [uncultured Cellulomonas sp.]|uniref:hypothetical protein n=1 Tax=uncultured Cellulomonas sp. TaxID=189682 RepID=UPI0028E3C0B5|nr:hypothetical protein [uncultured Cellulomonas sp.]
MTIKRGGEQRTWKLDASLRGQVSISRPPKSRPRGPGRHRETRPTLGAALWQIVTLLSTVGGAIALIQWLVVGL